jgi:hypothetical protein
VVDPSRQTTCPPPDRAARLPGADGDGDPDADADVPECPPTTTVTGPIGSAVAFLASPGGTGVTAFAAALLLALVAGVFIHLMGHDPARSRR